MNPNQNQNPSGSQPVAFTPPSAPNDVIAPSMPEQPAQPAMAVAVEPIVEVTPPVVPVVEQPQEVAPAPQVVEEPAVPVVDTTFQPVAQAPYGPEPQAAMPVVSPEPFPGVASAAFFAADQSYAEAAPTSEENPDKSYVAAYFLAFFLGWLGVDRFYLKKYVTGALKLLTLGGVGVWALVDFIMIAFGKFKAKNDPRQLKGYGEKHHSFKIAAVVLAALSVIVTVIFAIGFAAASQEQAFINQY